MRLDARNGPPAVNYTVWHAEECRTLKMVQWVDDETAQYGQFTGRVVCEEAEVATVQAHKIAIYPDRKLIIINPVEDNADVDQIADAIAT